MQVKTVIINKSDLEAAVLSILSREIPSVSQEHTIDSITINGEEIYDFTDIEVAISAPISSTPSVSREVKTLSLASVAEARAN